MKKYPRMLAKVETSPREDCNISHASAALGIALRRPSGRLQLSIHNFRIYPAAASCSIPTDVLQWEKFS